MFLLRFLEQEISQFGSGAMRRAAKMRRLRAHHPPLKRPEPHIQRLVVLPPGALPSLKQSVDRFLPSDAVG